MRKKIFIVALILLVSFCFVSCGGKSAEGSASATESAKTEKILAKLVSCWSETYPAGHADTLFIDSMKKMAGDLIDIELYRENTLVGPKEVFDAVADNVAEMGSEYPGYWVGKDTAFNLLAAWPMGMDVYDYTNWIFEGGGMDEYKRVYGKFGLEVFPFGPITIESGPRGTKPIKSLDDYKGLKLRISGSAQGIIAAKLGAAQVAIQSSEVYQAMQTGVIDAAESSTPFADWSLGYQEITQYASNPGWNQPGTICCLIVNKETFDKYPEKLKAMIETAAYSTFTKMIPYNDYKGAECALKFRDEYGVKMDTLSEKDLLTLQNWAYEIMYDNASKNPSFAQVAYSMAKYQHMYQYWKEAHQTIGGHGWAKQPLPDLEKLKSYVK